MAVSFGSGSAASSGYARNPRLVLWGTSMTHRTQNPQFGSASRAAGDVAIFLRWKVGEALFGAEEGWVDITSALVSSNQAYTDIDIKPDVALFGGVFSLLPGLWKFSLMAKTIRTDAENDQVRIYRIIANASDELIAESTSGIAAANGLGDDGYYVSGIQKTPPTEVGEDDIFYVINGDHDNLSHHSHYMELEYLGPA